MIDHHLATNCSLSGALSALYFSRRAFSPVEDQGKETTVGAGGAAGCRFKMENVNRSTDGGVLMLVERNAFEIEYSSECRGDRLVRSELDTDSNHSTVTTAQKEQHPSLNGNSLLFEFDKLLQRRQTLDHEIAAERRRDPADRSQLDWLEREAVRLRDELARYDGLFRTLSRRQISNWGQDSQTSRF